MGYLLAGLGQAMLVDQSQLVSLIAETLISTFTETALRSRIHIYTDGLDALSYSTVYNPGQLPGLGRLAAL